MTRTTTSRREFLKRATVLSASAGASASPLALSLLGMGSAMAQANDFKAIICLFMFGGNDSANMVLANDAGSWTQYINARQRDPEPIALLPAGTPADDGALAGTPQALGGIRPINPAGTVFASANSGRSFAVHPSMAETQALFDASRLSIVANAGPLIEPIEGRSTYGSRRRPPRLESHNDQQYLWQSLGIEGTTTGWGGRFGDLLASQNSQTLFTNISASGNAVFLAGQNTFQYQVGGNGAIAIGGLTGSLFGSSAASEALRNLVQMDSAHLIAKDYAAVTRRSIQAQEQFTTAFAATASVPTPTQVFNPSTRTLVNNPLAAQLRTVLRIMAARGSLGTRRQIFFVSTGGFDTHDNQSRTHANLMARVSHALGYFDQEVTALGLRDQVALFTASDFGRTFDSNGTGTDHAWGAHHFIYGGAMRGREVFGRFPQYGFGHADSYGNRGNWIPQISVDQVGATLGRWFGVSDSNLDLVFPNLSNFSQRDLGFFA